MLPKFFENPTGDPNAPSAKHIGMDGVTWEDLEDQLLFYENAQRQMRVSFPYSNFIFSTQPVVHDFDQMYGEGSYSNDPVKRTKARTKKMKELENLSIEYSNLELGEGYWPICRDYFHPMSAFNLETVAMRLSEKIVASTKYINMGKFFASNEEVRRDFFIDVVHLNFLFFSLACSSDQYSMSKRWLSSAG